MAIEISNQIGIGLLAVFVAPILAVFALKVLKMFFHGL
jgi:hypothetical protein